MGSDIPYTFKHTKFSRITKFWRCRYLRVRYRYFWLGTAAVPVAEYTEKDFLPVLQQVEKKKNSAAVEAEGECHSLMVSSNVVYTHTSCTDSDFIHASIQYSTI